MHTRATSNGHRGLAGAVKAVSERVSTLVRLELELAVLELKQKLSAIGVGIGLAVGAAVFAVFAFGFLFATIAAGLATFLATWLALLIVTLFLFAAGRRARTAGCQVDQEGHAARPAAGDCRRPS